MDESAMRELEIYIENNEQLYAQMYAPIQKNLSIKKYKNIYEPERAVDAFMYLVDEGARRYNKEYGDGSSSMKLFDMDTRRAVAKRLRDDFETEFKLGNYSKYASNVGQGGWFKDSAAHRQAALKGAGSRKRSAMATVKKRLGR